MHTIKECISSRFTVGSVLSCAAQGNREKHEVAFLFGLTQPPLITGFNVEVNYLTPKMVFDYSHGVSLDLSKDKLEDELKRQGLAVHVPSTTGFGIGYRFSRFLNLRIETKWHRFEMYDDGKPQTRDNQITAYNTFTPGLGLYGRWFPFRKSGDLARHTMIAPSVRYCPNVSNSLPGGTFTDTNTVTGKAETLKPLNNGAQNTPRVVNISIGFRLAASWAIMHIPHLPVQSTC